MKAIIHYENDKMCMTFCIEDVDSVVKTMGIEEYYLLEDDQILDITRNGFSIDCYDFDKETKTFVINIENAKKYLHEKRRMLRTIELYPIDAEIAKMIPNTFDSLEEKRKEIRKKYYVIQEEIDSADYEKMKMIIEKYKLNI